MEERIPLTSIRRVWGPYVDEGEGGFLHAEEGKGVSPQIDEGKRLSLTH